LAGMTQWSFQKQCSYLHLIWCNPSMPKYPSECTGGQILNFQNTLDRAWNEIRMKIQT
jgi:hypothetical protein